MTKEEMVQYLVNLDTLIKGQQTASSGVSQFLQTEYSKHWDLFKSKLKEEHESDETRKSKLERPRREEGRANLPPN